METDPHRQITDVVIANTKVYRTVKVLARDTDINSGEGVGWGIVVSTSVTSRAGEGAASVTSVRNVETLGLESRIGAHPNGCWCEGVRGSWGASPIRIGIKPHHAGNHRAPCWLPVWIWAFEHDVTPSGSPRWE